MIKKLKYVTKRVLQDIIKSKNLEITLTGQSTPLKSKTIERKINADEKKIYI